MCQPAADQPARRLVAFGRSPEKRFWHREVTRELAPLLFLQPLRSPAAEELLDVSGIAPEHAREAGEILAALRAQALQDKARVDYH